MRTFAKTCIAVAAVGILACSSKTEGATSAVGGGAANATGGSPSSGMGGAAALLVCIPGATQVCVGPGQCPGAQACNLTGSAWGTCECASNAGGTSSVGGSTTTGNASGGSPPTGGATANGGAATQSATGGFTTTGGSTGTSSGPIKIIGKVRDFHVTFPDVEPCLNNPSANPAKLCDSGHVEQNATPSDTAQNCGAGTKYPNSCFIGTTLGNDSKPVYIGPSNGTVTTTGPDNFKWWFNTDPAGQINQERDLELVLPLNSDGTYTYNSAAYFPIDGQLFGDEGQTDATGTPHNYGFTTEFHMKFQYRMGQSFYFKGDDDFWLFINGQLVIDRSGIHNAQDATIDLDGLGLTSGSTYSFDMFYCERHRTLSDILLTTNVAFTEVVAVN